jgi:hypothetical protein
MRYRGLQYRSSAESSVNEKKKMDKIKKKDCKDG